MTDIVEANVGPSLNVCDNTELINPKFLESFVTSVSARISMPGSIFRGISLVGQLFHKKEKNNGCLLTSFKVGFRLLSGVCLETGSGLLGKTL